MARVRALPSCKDARVVLAADGHVHSEWSWDAPDGAMERTCARERIPGVRAALSPEVVRWWAEEGGRVITFGSDGHDPTRLARGFAQAADLVEAHGFRAGQHPYDFWTRSS